MTTRFKAWITLLLALGVLLLLVTDWVYNKLQVLKSIDAIEAAITEDFPDVTHLAPADFATLREAEPGLLLVDCRKPEEYAVSRIPGAVNLRSAEEVQAYLEKETTQPSRIVSYCSVGWRSAKLTRALHEAGYAGAANLRGSIFRWANEDRPLEKPDGSPAQTVHPLHEVWSGLLDEGKAWTEP